MRIHSDVVGFEIQQERMSYYIISKTGAILWHYDFWRNDQDKAEDMLNASMVTALINWIKQAKFFSDNAKTGLIRWGKHDCRIADGEKVFLTLYVHNGSIISEDVGRHLDDFAIEVVNGFEDMYKKVLEDNKKIGNQSEYDNFEEQFIDKITSKMEEVNELYKKALVSEIENRTSRKDLPEEMINIMRKLDSNRFFNYLDKLGELVEEYREVENIEGTAEEYANYVINQFPKRVIVKLEELEKIYELLGTDGETNTIQAWKKCEGSTLIEHLSGLASAYEQVGYAVDVINDKFHSLCQIFKIPVYKMPRKYRFEIPKASDIKDKLSSSLAYGGKAK